MVGLVFINEIGVCPYIDKYIDELEKNGQEYEIIIWDRYYYKGKTYNRDNLIAFGMPANEKENVIMKLLHFYRYSKFLKKTIARKKYDKLIILSTLSGMVCYKELKTKYKGKYIFDYRDASYERLGLFYKLLTNIIDNSAFTCISSDGFRRILPNREYVLAHNFRYADLEKQVDAVMLNRSNPIKVSYIGLLREFSYHKRLIDIFGNDSRFVLRFHGDGPEINKIREYASEFNNVEITGRYNNDEKNKYNLDADMLLYNYPCSYNRNCALANKYYDGILYKKPMIANVDTFSGQLVKEKGLGVSLSFALTNDEYKNQVYDYYLGFDQEEFVKNANEELERILQEDKLYVEKIDGFILE